MDEDPEAESKVGPVEEGGDDEEEGDEGGGIEEEEDEGEEGVAVLQDCAGVILDREDVRSGKRQWMRVKKYQRKILRQLMMRMNQPTLNETESKTTMMMMVREAVNAQLMYQQSCNGLHDENNDNYGKLAY